MYSMLHSNKPETAVDNGSGGEGVEDGGKLPGEIAVIRNNEIREPVPLTPRVRQNPVMLIVALC